VKLTREEQAKCLYRYIKEYCSSKRIEEHKAQGFYKHFITFEDFVAVLYEQVVRFCRDW